MKYINYGTNLFTNESTSIEHTTGWLWKIGDKSVGRTKNLNFAITTPGVVKVTLQATDILDKTTSVTKTYNVLPKPPVILDNTLPDSVFGQEYSTYIHTSTLAEPARFYSRNLPAWAHIDVTTGEISGIPTEESVNNITILVQDAVGRVTSKNFVLKAVCPQFNPIPDFTWETFSFENVTLNEIILPDANFQEEYTATFTVVQGTGIAPYSFEGTNLPEGLTLDSNTGVLSGTITTINTSYEFIITVTDSLGSFDSKTFTLTNNIPAPSITFDAGTTEYGEVYTNSITATGAAPFTFGGTVAPGLAIDVISGEITGTVTGTSSQYDWHIEVTDYVGQVSSIDLVVPNTYTTPTILERTLEDIAHPNLNNPYLFNMHLTGGTAPYTWEATLMPGLSIDATGEISGTPTGTEESYLWTITVTDKHNLTDTIAVDMPVDWDNVVLDTLNIENNMPGFSYEAHYSYQVPLISGEDPLTWEISGAPSGIIISDTGEISGTPTGSASEYTVTITVTDSRGTTAATTITVPNTYNPPVIAKVPPDQCTYGLPYTYGISISGGTPEYTIHVGGLPNGLTLNNAVVEGTCLVENGTYPISIAVIDSLGLSDTYTTSISVVKNVPNIILPNPIPTTEYGVNFNLTLQVENGTGPFVWEISNLTPGLSLDSDTGNVTGNVTGTDASYNWLITVTDSVNLSDNVNLEVANTVASPVINQTEVLDVEIGVAYHLQLTSDTGALPLTWTLSGAPTGISIDSATGLISGTTSDSPGTSTWTATVTDAIGQTDTAVYADVKVESTAPLIEEDSVPDVTLNTPYSYQLNTTSGTGTPPITWASGTLPSGLTLETTGLLHGTVTTPFTDQDVVFMVTDSLGHTSSKSVAVGIVEIPPTVDYTSDGMTTADTEPYVDQSNDALPDRPVIDLEPAAPYMDYVFDGSGESTTSTVTPVEPTMDYVFDGSGESISGDEIVTAPTIIIDFTTIDDLPITSL